MAHFIIYAFNPRVFRLRRRKMRNSYQSRN